MLASSILEEVIRQLADSDILHKKQAASKVFQSSPRCIGAIPDLRYRMRFRLQAGMTLPL